jgi:hypothetical protein
MNYRLTQILAEESASTAGTKTLDIDIADPISEISIFYRGQNNGNTPLAHPAKMVTKIEVVNGSDTLMSLSGMQTQALDFFHKSQPPMQKLMYTDDDWTRLVFNLNFGRYLYDPRFAFVPRNYLNPQLKITHNMALGGCTCNDAKMEVWAHCFDEKKVSPEGFLAAKEYYSYALGNNTYETIDLPRDYPYRMILVRALRPTLAIWELFDEVKLSSDQDKHVIIDGATRQLIKILDDKFGFYTETIQGLVGVTDVAFYFTPTSNCNIVANSRMEPIGYFRTWQTFGGYSLINSNVSVGNFQALAHGNAPHGALCIPFGDLQDPSDWFDVAKVEAALKLKIHAVSGLTTTDTCDVVIQQLRK